MLIIGRDVMIDELKVAVRLKSHGFTATQETLNELRMKL
jgi:hypothetical protein